MPAPSVGLLSMTQPVCACTSRARIVAMLGRNTVLTPPIRPRAQEIAPARGPGVAAAAAFLVDALLEMAAPVFLAAL